MFSKLVEPRVTSCKFSLLCTILFFLMITRHEKKLDRFIGKLADRTSYTSFYILGPVSYSCNLIVFFLHNYVMFS